MFIMMARHFNYIGKGFFFILLMCYSCQYILAEVHGSRNMDKMTSKNNNKNNVNQLRNKMPKHKSEDFKKKLDNRHPIQNSNDTATRSNDTGYVGTTGTVGSAVDSLNLPRINKEQMLKPKDYKNKTFHAGKRTHKNKKTREQSKNVKINLTTKNKLIMHSKNSSQDNKIAKKLLVSFFNDDPYQTGHSSNKPKSHGEKKGKSTTHTISTTTAPTGEVDKRTKLLATNVVNIHPETRKLQETKVKVIETVLPSGPKSSGPQHVQINNQPTHIMFKPIHKYYPTIHRYMTHPINRYLNKPVSGLTPRIPKPRLAVQPALLPQTRTQQNQGPILQDSVPGGLSTGKPLVQGDTKQVAPIRIYASVPSRIQPVLLHPHKMSSTGYGPCTTNPCKNSGICSSVRDQPLCICRPGFRGELCELINKCYPNPCHNFGSCTEIERDFQCTCKKGFRGKNCEVENKCEPNPCVNGGTCSEIEDDYVCSCREGFLGHSCEAESKCGPINPCKNGATCQEARDTYKCFCRDGFAGYNCEARMRHFHCTPNPCSHGGFCTVTGTSPRNFTCNCIQGWKGSTCTEKVDNWGNAIGPSICESMNPCMFGGKCSPISYYDYSCECPSGRSGPRCEHNLVRKHPTHSCSDCHAFARCLKDNCKCNKGYEGDGKQCVPVIQYCHPNPCYNGGTCQEQPKLAKIPPNDQKKWWCKCPIGYSGTNCEEMDLCQAHICQNGGKCLSSQNEARCLCKEPYKGKYCEERNVCYENPCRNGGTCKDVEGVATCFCSLEYDGVLCDHWKCGDCDTNARCDKGICRCNDDYSGDGKSCRKKMIAPAPTAEPFQLAVPIRATSSTAPTFCDSYPCTNGATCLEAVSTYYCQCPQDKFGKKCDQTSKVLADLCSKCDTDAICRDGKCICNEGYSGSGFSCRKSQVIPEEQILKNLHKTDSSCDFCPENGQCLNNICVCPPGFKNVKRSCVEIDVSAINRDGVAMKKMPKGIQYVGLTKNRSPVGQWKEDSVVSEYKSLGCWADTKEWRNPIMRALESLEGLHPSLNEDYEKRQNPITKCASASKAFGYKIFAVQNGGQCFSGQHADQSYKIYGPSVRCRFGVGGQLSNDVYELP